MAKKLRDEDLVLNIIVNGDKGKKEIGQLERAIKDTTAELRSLEKQEKRLRAGGKKDTEQYRAVTAAIKQKNDAIAMSESRLKQLKQGLDLNSMSLRDLRSEMNRLSRLRNIATPGTEEWNKHNEELQKVRARYREVNGQSQETGSVVQKMSSRAAKAIGWITAAVASLAAAISGIRKATDMFSEFDDQVADVMKTTGLLKSEVLEINENLKQFDTRSSQEELLALGRVAGKLGIDIQEDVEGFIRAADQIGVALAEDLPGDIEQAINDIGKLVDVFNVADEFGIEEGMLKVGSAINELGAASTANEGYLVDFVKRLGGVGPAAGISIANIMGLGATLDQFGQSVEVSGTAMSQLIVKMFSDTEGYAKIAGMRVEEFSDLLQKDANEALITLLDRVKGNTEGMEQLVANLQDLGLRGARAIQVVSVLSNNTDALRAQQALANKAFEEGTSLTEESTIKNETAAAQLDKARKRVNLLWIELGERLFPVITAGNSVMAIFLETIVHIFDFVRENWKLITVLTVAIVSYNGALFLSNTYTRIYIAQSKLRLFWENAMLAGTQLLSAAQMLLAGNVRGAAQAMRVFNSVAKLNPFVLIAATAIAAGTAIYLYTKRLSSAEVAQKSLLNVQNSAQKAIVEERIEMERLLAVARDKTRSDDERAGAVKALNELSPEYLGNLTLEKIHTEEATKATEAYTKSLLRKAMIEAANERLVEVAKKRIDIARDATDLSFFDQVQAAIVGRGNVIANNVAKAVQDLTAEEQALIKLINENSEPIDASTASRRGVDPVVDLPDGETEQERKAREKRGKEAERARKKEETDRERELQKQKEYREKIIAEQETLADQERIAYMKRLEDAGLFGKQREHMTADELAALEALQAQHHENLNKMDAAATKEAIDKKQAAFEAELQQLRIQHNEQYKEIKTMEEARAFLRDDLSADALRGLTNMRQAQQEIDKKFRREEEALVKAHLEGLKADLQDVLDSGQWEGLELSDKVLSDEEREIINAKLEEVRVKLSELGLGSGTQIAEERGQRRSRVDILGFTSDDWELFFENIESGKARVDDLVMATQSLGSIWSQYNALVSAGEQRKMQEFERDSKAKEDRLKKQLERGVINQEKYNKGIDRLNADLDKKKAVYERNQAKRERNVALMSAIVNTAAAVTKSLPNLILAAIVGAMGALQIGTIAKTPLPQIPGAEDGGYIDVVRSQDKKLFRAAKNLDRRGFVDRPTILVGESGREFVASNEAYNNPTIRPVLDAIDTAQRNGQISTVNLSKILSNDRSIRYRIPGRQQGGYFDDRTSSPGAVPPHQQDSEMKELLRRNLEATNRLNARLESPIQADVSLLGRRGFYEAERDYINIKDNVNL